MMLLLVQMFFRFICERCSNERHGKKWQKNPIIFACANPDPEITPEEIEEVRDDAIIATGRSDYPNQVNNLIGFPYIFRGIRCTIKNN